MKKLLLTVVMAGLMVTGAQAKQWKEVRVAIEGAYPPFSSVDEKGQLQFVQYHQFLIYRAILSDVPHH